MRLLQNVAGFLAMLALSHIAVATPVELENRDPEPASQCQTPPIRCCNSILGLGTILPPFITDALPPGLNATQLGEVGLNCTEVDISTNPLAPTPTCDGSTVCCEGNLSDAIAFNCQLVSIPTPTLLPTLPLPPLSSILPLPPLTSILPLPPLTSILPLPPLTSILPLPPLTSILPLPPLTSILPLPPLTSILPLPPLSSILPILPL
ncbi:hydrophobin [Phlebiopsis gigantea 11061_1 CR5-6]|uniref:Hydrophobin n=1 Tax=Phlebiopsis gigantea (strain 11061_1 CR5-6) TaxID=745531 RepID=A0A0C3SCG9_PHLG1|nr:hydrophobin [Phlebiopsis gigantea 11061_1 CR5-6]